MSHIDLALLIIIGGFALFGLWFGLVHTLGSLMGTLAGAYIASRYYEPLANWLISFTHWNPNSTRVVMFILAFLIINRLVGFAFWIVDKILSIVTRLPFINSLNHLLGLFFGFLEGIITVGLVIYFIERFPVSPTIMNALANSRIAPYTVTVASILIPLLPAALRLLQSSVDYVRHVVVTTVDSVSSSVSSSTMP